DSLMVAVVDFCLKLRKVNRRNILCPSVELSIPRDSADQLNNHILELISPADLDYLTQHWSDWINHDPAFNTNLTIVEEGKILVNLSPRSEIVQ
ncbi:MAG: hypothetical protein ACK2TV_07380, partial [Anaerolineales bacterium]